MITVMMLAYNECDIIKAAIQSFRLFSDIDISFILIDNGSTDGLQEWASEQADLTYVLMDEGPIGWGKAVNMVKKELDIDTDILIIEGNYMLTPQCLSRMAKLLHEEDDIAGVCGSAKEVIGYEQLIGLSDEVKYAGRKKVMKPDSGAILWKKETLEEVGNFDEELHMWSKVVDDYCLRVIQADKTLLMGFNVLFGEVKTKNNIEYEKIDKDLLCDKWGMHYFNSVYNPNIIPLLGVQADKGITVLEIGCDCGATLLEIKHRFPNAKVYGTEVNPQAASIAAHFAQVMVNNIEEKELPFEEEMFDYIIFGDVLEHLHNPLEILEYCRMFLKEGGEILASIPNLMHISVIEQLLRGDFTYTDIGLLDKTHIHLFTYNEIVRIFDKAGYDICEMRSCRYLKINDKQRQIIDSLLSIEDAAQSFMYETCQYAVRAGKRKNG